MTFDETRNSWFPHVSPDGKSVIFITYYKGDLEPGQHLPNKNVELRIMPATGGKPKTLVKLFGGQGTINVNSWAPELVGASHCQLPPLLSFIQISNSWRCQNYSTPNA